MAMGLRVPIRGSSYSPWKLGKCPYQGSLERPWPPPARVLSGSWGLGFRVKGLAFRFRV